MEQKRRWSSLPDDIVNNIISRLNLVRDTITISTMSFSIKQSHNQIDNPTYNIYEYWTILDNLFIIFAPPVFNKFSLDFQANRYDKPRCWPIINSWARQLRSRNVQHVNLSCSQSYGQSDNQFMGPPSVFRMHSLVTLELNFGYSNDDDVTWRLPNSIALPKLKNLIMHHPNYSYFGRLLSCCPSLEYLFLSLYNPQEKAILITSTSLKRLCLSLNGTSFRDVIIDIPKLEEFDYSTNSLLPMQMLDSISKNVKSLRLGTGTTTRFNNCRPTISLSELTRLEISLSAEIFQAIFGEQIMDCPNLEVIVLHLSMMNAKHEAMVKLVQRVKRIELYTGVYRFNKNVLNLVTGLLKSAKVLEKLVLYAPVPRWPDKDDNLVKYQFWQTLFECVESTSGCQVELLGAYELVG